MNSVQLHPLCGFKREICYPNKSFLITRKIQLSKCIRHNLSRKLCEIKMSGSKVKLIINQSKYVSFIFSCCKIEESQLSNADDFLLQNIPSLEKHNLKIVSNTKFRSTNMPLLYIKIINLLFLILKIQYFLSLQ